MTRYTKREARYTKREARYTKREARGAAEKSLRVFVRRYLRWPPVTNADCAAMMVSTRSRTYTRHGVPAIQAPLNPQRPKPLYTSPQKSRHPESRLHPQPAPQLRDPSPGKRHRHPLHPGTPRPHLHPHHRTLHPRSPPKNPKNHQPPGLSPNRRLTSCAFPPPSAI